METGKICAYGNGCGWYRTQYRRNPRLNENIKMRIGQNAVRSLSTFTSWDFSTAPQITYWISETILCQHIFNQSILIEVLRFFSHQKYDGIPYNQKSWIILHPAILIWCIVKHDVCVQLIFVVDRCHTNSSTWWQLSDSIQILSKVLRTNEKKKTVRRFCLLHRNNRRKWRTLNISGNEPCKSFPYWSEA